MLNARDKDDERIQHASNICFKFGISVTYVWIGEYTSEAMHKLRNRLINKHIASKNWIIHADADEFHFYPKPLTDLLLDCEDQGITAVQGVFTDRIDSQGRLKPITDSESIYKQFPTLANLNNLWYISRRHAPATGVVKMMAYKKGLITNRGGHIIKHTSRNLPIKYALGIDLAKHQDILQTPFRENCLYQVHHFKWHKGVINKLQRRVKIYKQIGYKWWVNSQHLINSIDNEGRIPIKVIDIYEDQSQASPIQ